MKDLVLLERREGDICLVRHDKFGLALATLDWLQKNRKRVYNIGYISTIQVAKPTEYFCYYCKRQFQYRRIKCKPFQVLVEEVRTGKIVETLTCEAKSGETSTTYCPHCHKETGLWPCLQTISVAKKKSEEKLINVVSVLMKESFTMNNE